MSLARTFDDSYEFAEVHEPAAITTGTKPATYIDMNGARSILFVIRLGATDNDFDAKVVQATAAAGTGSKDVTGAAITQLEGTDDNKTVTIQVDAERLDIANGFKFVALTFTVAGTTTASVHAWKMMNRHIPVTQPAVYEEQVTVQG